MVIVTDLRGYRHLIEGLYQHLGPGAILECILADMAAPGACTGLPGKKAEHVSRYPPETFAAGKFSLDIGNHLHNDIAPIGRAPARIEMLFQLREKIRIVVSLPTDHYTVDVAENLVEPVRQRVRRGRLPRAHRQDRRCQRRYRRRIR